MRNEEIKNLNYDTKIDIWMHYCWKQLVSIHVPLEFNLNESRFEVNSRAIKYPILGIYTLTSGFNVSMIRSFDDFCNEPDDRVSSGLLGYYHRFADEIFVE